MATLATPTPLEATVEETVKTVPLPKGIRLRRIYLDTDSIGDPAVYIVFSVSRRLGSTPTIVRQIGALESAVLAAVEALTLNRYAYVRFEDAR